MPSCRDCHYFIIEPADLEQAIPGLNILSSAYGSVRADTALCQRHDRFITPMPACADFVLRATPSSPD